MTIKRFFIFFISLLAVTALSAATQTFTFNCSTKVIRNGRATYENRAHTYVFTAEVISDSRGVLPEGWRWGRPFVTAMRGERYGPVTRPLSPVISLWPCSVGTL